MGDLNVIPVVQSTDLRAYTRLLFRDVQALERMINEGMIEEGVTRIGAEQELCLLDHHSQPALKSEEVLGHIEDPHFTTELAKFNLEINLDPLLLQQGCFLQLEQTLLQLMAKCQEVCVQFECLPILTGILPTIGSRNLGLESMTPRLRYQALNDAIQYIRRGPQEFHIQGTDELVTRHNSVMFESCNTSFQVHYQVGASDFNAKYNWAQAIAAPVLAACTNSPLFLGKRLWSETRIALFQQATDTRGYQEELRLTKPRVVFGDRWLGKDITELTKGDISTYRPLVIGEGIEDAIEQLDRGEVPKLKAFSLFNGTVYRWNRPCYGITEGKPHLRIENRYLPAGPSVMDEIANAAFWIGLMHGMQPRHQKVDRELEFHQIRTNFLRAARYGLSAKLDWIGGKAYDVADLVVNELIPISREGLKRAGIDKEETERFLGVIRERVRTGKTGSEWIMNAFNSLSKTNSQEMALAGLTDGIVRRQQENKPVHQWTAISPKEIGDGPYRYMRIDQIMSKNLYTVREEDLIDLVPNLMKWNQIRHMLVENSSGELVGLVSLGRLGQYYAEHQDDVPSVMVKDVMVKDVITVTPTTKTLDAIRLMQKHRIGCLPVLNQDQKLVGIVTEQDFIKVAASYLAQAQD